MSTTLIHDCPRCGVKKLTFDVAGVIYIRKNDPREKYAEVFSCCRECGHGTIFILSDESNNHLIRDHNIMRKNGNLNGYCSMDGIVNFAEFHTIDPPSHLPPDVQNAFSEGARAYAAECWNAAACMFRASIDIATRGLLPKGDVDDLDDRTRRSLARRLKWLFDSRILQRDLEGLASCVKEDGNDAAHSTTLDKVDAIDLLEFTVALLERIYTEPEKIKLADQRRKERRAKSGGARIE